MSPPMTSTRLSKRRSCRGRKSIRPPSKRCANIVSSGYNDFVRQRTKKNTESEINYWVDLFFHKGTLSRDFQTLYLFCSKYSTWAPQEQAKRVSRIFFALAIFRLIDSGRGIQNLLVRIVKTAHFLTNVKEPLTSVLLEECLVSIGLNINKTVHFLNKCKGAVNKCSIRRVSGQHWVKHK